MRVAPSIQLSDEQRLSLERWARGRSTPVRLVLRSKIALLAAGGRTNKQIAWELRCGTKTVSLWRSRFARHGIAGIEKDAPRGGKRTAGAEMLTRQIIEKTLHEPPPRRPSLDHPLAGDGPGNLARHGATRLEVPRHNDLRPFERPTA